MAVLTITVDDSQVSRVRDAYGVATNANLRTAIIADIRQKVVRHEANTAEVTAAASVKTAQDNLLAAIATAETNAASISIT